MMRIAYVCADAGVPVFGSKGCSVHVQEVIRALRQRGVWVHLFAARLGGDAPEDLRDIPLSRIPAGQVSDQAMRERIALAANDGLLAALEGERAFDMVYERYSLWSFAAMEYARGRGIPGLLEVNAPLIEEQARHRGLIDRRAAERVARRAFEAAELSCAVSNEVAAYVTNVFPATRGRVAVVANGVSIDRFPAGLRASHIGDAGAFTVGFVGSLKPWHGLADLVDGFATLHVRHPESRLLVVGDGPERLRLETALARRGLSDAADVIGAVSPSDVPGLLASMDATVAPYPASSDCNFYFSPLKVYEYMAAARPVVASNIGQLATLIRHDDNGLLYPPGDVRALTTALGRLVVEPSLGARLGHAARQCVLRRHTWQAVAERIMRLAGLIEREGESRNDRHEARL